LTGEVAERATLRGLGDACVDTLVVVVNEGDEEILLGREMPVQQWPRAAGTLAHSGQRGSLDSAFLNQGAGDYEKLMSSLRGLLGTPRQRRQLNNRLGPGHHEITIIN
jgi:hypothetical protein